MDDIQMVPGQDATAQGRLFAAMLTAMEAASSDYNANGPLVAEIRAKMYEYRDRLLGAGWEVKAGGGAHSKTWTVKPPKG